MVDFRPDRETEMSTITTKAQALEAVENAAWDENDSALSGADIWGTHGEFAGPRAASFFTYRLAVEEAMKAPDSGGQYEQAAVR